MTLETIYVTLLAAAPAITSVVGIIASVVKLVRSGINDKKQLIAAFEEVKQEVHNNKQYEELKAELAQAHAENRALIKQNNEILTTLTKIEHKEV